MTRPGKDDPVTLPAFPSGVQHRVRHQTSRLTTMTGDQGTEDDGRSQISHLVAFLTTWHWITKRIAPEAG